MTDPIGTAQDRELPCDHCGKLERQHVAIIGSGLVCPMQGCTFSNAMSRALQSRIAEVGRLEQRVRELGGGCEANDGGLHSIMGGDKEPFCPDCGLMLKRIAYVLPHLKPNDVRAALSLQRRV